MTVSVCSPVASLTKFGKWSSAEGVYGSIDGGFPLAVFDSEMKNAVVLSPLSTFMSAAQTTIKSETTKDSFLTFGPLSSIDTVGVRNTDALL